MLEFAMSFWGLTTLYLFYRTKQRVESLGIEVSGWYMFIALGLTLPYLLVAIGQGTWIFFVKDPAMMISLPMLSTSGIAVFALTEGYIWVIASVLKVTNNYLLGAKGFGGFYVPKGQRTGESIRYIRNILQSKHVIFMQEDISYKITYMYKNDICFVFEVTLLRDLIARRDGLSPINFDPGIWSREKIEAELKEWIEKVLIQLEQKFMANAKEEEQIFIQKIDSLYNSIPKEYQKSVIDELIAYVKKEMARREQLSFLSFAEMRILKAEEVSYH